jgi:hypothetical protein
MSTRTKAARQGLAADVIFAALPGPSRKRTPSPYCYRLTYQNADSAGEGCVLAWDVLGGRDVYQVALERLASGKLCWHCSCADAVYRGESRAQSCKHVRGLQATGRAEMEVIVAGA